MLHTCSQSRGNSRQDRLTKQAHTYQCQETPSLKRNPTQPSLQPKNPPTSKVLSKSTILIKGPDFCLLTAVTIFRLKEKLARAQGFHVQFSLFECLA